jgi:protein tyrosine phosphatase (PTP) superfamily phosphohydrolase (DUF442 family)
VHDRAVNVNVAINVNPEERSDDNRAGFALGVTCVVRGRPDNHERHKPTRPGHPLVIASGLILACGGHS